MFCMKKLRLPFDHDQAEASKLIKLQQPTRAAPVAALPTWVLLLAATIAAGRTALKHINYVDQAC